MYYQLLKMVQLFKWTTLLTGTVQQKGKNK